MLSEKQHIEKLFQEISSPHRNTKTSAQSINKIAMQALSGNLYVNELLQNADDAKHKDTNGRNTDIAARRVNFILEGEYLIFQHDGRHFTHDDVEGLCDLGNTEREKVHDPDAIGNKGVGFKAVFNISEKVYVISQGYRFCFDKNHPQWKDNPQAVPWQIIPIWQEMAELPNAISRNLPNNDLVTFAIKLSVTNHNLVKQALEHMVLNQGRVILFLRSVQEVNIRVVGRNHIITKKIDSVEGQFSQITINTNSSNTNSSAPIQWHIYVYQFSVDQNVRKLIIADSNIVQKYKDKSSIDVQLAIPIGHSNRTTDDSNIFCFLPTFISSHLPFVVNADFMLDLARKGFDGQTNCVAWNHMILKTVYMAQFLLLAHIAKKGHWQNVLDFIAFPENNDFGFSQTTQAHIVSGFDQEKIKHAFVSDQNGTIRKIESLRIDGAQFFTSIGYQAGYEKIAHGQLSSMDKLKKLGRTYYGYDDIINFLKQEGIKKHILDINVNQRLVAFLINIISYVKDKDHKTYEKFVKDLKEIPFILSDRNILIVPKASFLPTSDFRYITDSNDIVSMVTPAFNSVEFISFFKSELGISALTAGAIIGEVNKREDGSQCIAVVLAVFQEFCGQSIATRVEFAKKWSGLKLKTREGYAVSNDCYLPDSLKPDFVLGFEYEKQIDLSVYCKTQDSNTLQLWYEFFIAINAYTTLMPTNIKSIVKAFNFVKNKSVNINFFRQLKQFFYQDNQAAPLLEDCRGIAVLTTQNNFSDDRELLYLADHYVPQMSLQAHVTELHYVSLEYLESGSDISQWRGFFLALGLKEKLSFSSRRINSVGRDIPYNHPLNAYVNWLVRDYQAQPGGTIGYVQNHTISNCYEINHFEIIKKHQFFWNILWREWSLVQPALVEQVVYDTNYGGLKREVPSSIAFFVREAARTQFKCDITELYSPRIKEVLGDEYDLKYFFDPSHTLTDEQVDVLNLKKQLSFADCIRILQILSTKPPKEAKTQVHIKYVYQQLINTKPDDDVTAEQLGQLKLLNEKDEFTESSELLVLTSNELKIKQNAKFVKRFNEIELSDFVKICEKLQITPARMTIEPSVESVNMEWTNKIIEKLALLCLVESIAQDITEDKFSDFVQKYVQALLNKKATFEKCRSISIQGEGWIDVTRKWIKASENKIYYVGECDYSFITECFGDIAKMYGWKISSANFMKILTRNIDSVIEDLGLDKDKLEVTRSAIQQIQSGNIVSPSTQVHDEVDIHNSQASAGGSLQSQVPYRSQVPLNYLQPINSNNNNLISAEPLASQYNDSSNHSGELIQKMKDITLVGPQYQGNSSHVTSGFHNQLAGGLKRSLDQMQTDIPPTAYQQNQSLSQQQLQIPVSPSVLINPPAISQLPMQTQRTVEIDDTGRTGEQYFLEFLRKRYREKHQDCQYTETSAGFILSKANYKKEITWINKNGEKGQPYDYVIETTTAKCTKKRLVDVKSSKSQKFDEFKINYSAHEWQAIQQQQQQSTSATVSPYYFYYVGNLTAGQPFVKKANISAQFTRLGTEQKLTIKDLTTSTFEDASTVVKDIKQITIKL